MNNFEKILFMLQGEMAEATSFGWFHLLWIFLTIIAIFILFRMRNKHSDKQLKWVLGIYGIIALLLEVLKQISWAFNYDPVTNLITWEYEWYAAPFQLCTTPIYVSLICLFLKNTKIRKSLLSYMAYVTILGSFMTIIIPDDCLIDEILINIHTMWLHCGSFVVSIYLLISKEVEINIDNFKRAFVVFLIFAFIAEVLNIVVYNSGILNGDTFNMFYISPYFISSLPIFNLIQEIVPFVIFLLIYIFAIFVGSLIVYGISYMIQEFNRKINHECK